MTLHRQNMSSTTDELLQLVGFSGDSQQKAKEKYEEAQRYVEEGKKIAKYLSSIKKAFDQVSNVLGLGGSNDERFIKRYYEMKDALNAAGYGVDNSVFKTWLDKYDVRKTDVDDHKPQSYWFSAFKRLRMFFIEWLNYANPGLGTDYGKLFPEWKMKSEGQIYNEPVNAMKLIVQAYPRGTYAPGTLLDPGSTDDIQTQEAGFGFWTILALCVLFGGLFLSNLKDSSGGAEKRNAHISGSAKRRKTRDSK